MPIEPRGHKQAERRCIALRDELERSSDDIDRRPAVLAYEYWRLGQELQTSRAYAATLQLKDLAEVLVEVPTIVPAQLLVEFGTPEQCSLGLAVLVAPQPFSLGKWCESGIRLAQFVRLLPDVAPNAPVLELLVNERGRASPLASVPRDRVVICPDEVLGHGALRVDLHDSMDEFEVLVRRVLEALRLNEEAFALLGLRPEGAPHIGLAEADALGGIDSAKLHSRLHNSALLALQLFANDAAPAVTGFDLGPYLCLQLDEPINATGNAEVHGDAPPFVHAYLPRKRLRSRHVDGVHLPDYQSGNQARASAQDGVEMLRQDLANMPLVPDQADAEGNTRDQALRAILDRLSSKRDYADPEYLRQWISELVTDPSRNRGQTWLRVPGDEGKTLFSLSLDIQAHGVGQAVLVGNAMPPSLAANVQIVVVALRREYRCTPLSLAWEVQRPLERADDKESLSLGHYLATEGLHNPPNNSATDPREQLRRLGP